MTDYDPVNSLFSGVHIPPITREEATRAARKLIRIFGHRRHGAPHQLMHCRQRRVRRCWITSQENAGLDRGWRRLIHDVSHYIFRARHPGLRPHHPAHARLELEVASYVLEAGWLSGALRATPKAKQDVVTVRAAKARQMLGHYETKLKRTQTLLKKWKRKVAYYDKRLSEPEGAENDQD